MDAVLSSLEKFATSTRQREWVDDPGFLTALVMARLSRGSPQAIQSVPSVTEVPAGGGWSVTTIISAVGCVRFRVVTACERLEM